MKHSSFSFIVILALSVGSGCVRGPAQSLSSSSDEIKINQSPFVEAYIQYPGSDPRWAGPASWTIHVTARDSQVPSFEVTPALPKLRGPGAPELSGRVPASALGLTLGRTVPDTTVAPQRLTVEQVRDRLQHLGEAIASAEEEKSACVSLVKVRLTRADGAIVEKRACRGSTAWTQIASELAAEWMTFSRISVPENASTAAAENNS